MSGVPRCFDCLNDFAPEQERFAVIKQMRDWPDGDPLAFDPAERRQLQALLCDQVFVSADCVGWYGDDAISVSAYEAGHA